MGNLNKKKFDIYERTIDFAIGVAKLLNKLPRSIALNEYGKQVIRSSGSIGANMEEANGAVSKKDFVNKVGIARKESRESRHWLLLIKRVESVTNEPVLKEIDFLINEAKELTLILSSIIIKTQKT